MKQPWPFVGINEVVSAGGPRESRRLLGLGRSTWYVTVVLVVGLAVLMLGVAGVATCSPAEAAGVLIVAPHPDDDLLYGAGVAVDALARGATVKVVYVTNGDYYDGTAGGYARQDDAVRGQTRHIGTVEDDLIFLGYPDAGLSSLLYAYPGADDLYFNRFGRSTTYGDRGLGRSDYHYYRFGTHAPYNGASVLQDLDEILTTYRPDDVYSTGPYDEHSDHEATYRFVRAAIVARMAADSSYAPTLHHTIVHWQGDDDWPAELDPQTNMVEPPGLADTGLSWSARESLVVPAAMQTTNLSANPKYLALAEHISDFASGYLGRFVHRDEVFWIEYFAGGTNRSPTAAAGPTQTVFEHSLVQLDGSGSSDLDGDSLSYAWTQTSGPAVTLSNSSAMRPTFTAPTAPATLRFGLVVSDGHAVSIPASVAISVVSATPALSINDVSVTEGNDGSKNLVFTVGLSAVSGRTVTVAYGTANGTAVGDDYTTVSGSLSFAPGVSSQTVTVPVVGDLLDEADETLSVILSAAGNATIADTQGVGTILDDDAAPALSINDVSVTEGNDGSKNLVFTVGLSAVSGRTVTVAYGTANGTAVGDDYTTVSGSLSFAPGVSSQTVTVPVVGDLLDEADETLSVILSAAGNATIADTQGVGTILDDDAAPALSINDVSVTEGNDGSKNLVFTVGLSAVSGRTVTVAYGTANGTAVGDDYTTVSGSLSFAPGVSSQTVTVPVVGDLLDEADETLSVILSAAGNATIADTQGVGTILDDDAAPALSINDVSVTEGNDGSKNLVFTVGLSAVSGRTVTVAYGTVRGTAKPGSDFRARNGALTFRAGTLSRTLSVKVYGDRVVERNETFFVKLSKPADSTLAKSRGTGTIRNNDRR